MSKKDYITYIILLCAVAVLCIGGIAAITIFKDVLGGFAFYIYISAILIALSILGLIAEEYNHHKIITVQHSEYQERYSKIRACAESIMADRDVCTLGEGCKLLPVNLVDSYLSFGEDFSVLGIMVNHENEKDHVPTCITADDLCTIISRKPASKSRCIKGHVTLPLGDPNDHFGIKLNLLNKAGFISIYQTDTVLIKRAKKYCLAGDIIVDGAIWNVYIPHLDPFKCEPLQEYENECLY